jgi:predicted DNA-binding transcriptional regulator AlpA
MTSGDVAKLLGLTRQRVHQIIEEDPTFPAPAMVLGVGRGRVWETAAVEKWARATGRIK